MLVLFVGGWSVLGPGALGLHSNPNSELQDTQWLKDTLSQLSDNEAMFWASDFSFDLQLSDSSNCFLFCCLCVLKHRLTGQLQQIDIINMATTVIC